MRHTLTSRRMALVGATLLIGLTACGSPTDPSSSAVTTVISADGPAVLRLVAAGGGGPASGASDSMPNEAGKMMMPMSIEYVFSGTAPDLTAPAGSWYFPAGVAATPEQVAAVAKALGVEGDVRTLPADQGGGLMVGPDDYSGPTLYVGSDSMLGWSYSPGPSAVMSAPNCGIAVDPMPIDAVPVDTGAAVADTLPVDPAVSDPGIVPEPCPEPQPPANVPTKAEAEAMARAVFASLGIDLGSYQLETYADEWGANVNAYLVLDGMRTSLSMSVGFGAEGAVTWAGGYLATPLRGDDYPRIGVEAAVQRLNDQSNWWMYPMAAAKSSVDPASAGVAASGGPAPLAVPPQPSDTGAPIEPAPVDTSAPFEPLPPETILIDPGTIDTTPIVVTLTDPAPSLEMMWADDGTIWLLPGYTFQSTDGGIYSVLAVPDEFIQQAQPELLPVDALPVDTVVIDTVPVDTVVQASPMTLEQAAAILVGLVEADAASAATAAGIEMRVVQIDAVPQPVTEDYRIGRYNVSVDGGVVTAVLSNG